jgi:hypothetical protein
MNEQRLGNISAIEYSCDYCGADHPTGEHEILNNPESKKETAEEIRYLANWLKRVTGDNTAISRVKGDSLIVSGDFAFQKNVRAKRQEAFLAIHDDPNYFKNVRMESGEIFADLVNPIGPVKKIVVSVTKDM